MYVEKLAAKYGLEIDTESFEGLVIVSRVGSPNTPSLCKIFTRREIESDPDIESKFASIAIESLW